MATLRLVWWMPSVTRNEKRYVRNAWAAVGFQETIRVLSSNEAPSGNEPTMNRRGRSSGFDARSSSESRCPGRISCGASLRSNVGIMAAQAEFCGSCRAALQSAVSGSA